MPHVTVLPFFNDKVNILQNCAYYSVLCSPNTALCARFFEKKETCQAFGSTSN